MSWELVDEGTLDRTERLAVEGGYLIRSVWRHARGIGVEPLDGSAMTFVAAADNRAAVAQDAQRIVAVQVMQAAQAEAATPAEPAPEATDEEAA